jgi:ferredoxin
MRTVIFYYTGTGNSLWVGRNIAAAVPSAEVVSIVTAMEKNSWPALESVGIVFPVHAWGLPPRIIEFARRANVTRESYIFGVATHAGQVSDTLLQLKRKLHARGLRLSAGFEVKMPSNYIPWGGPGPVETQENLFESAKSKTSRIASVVSSRKSNPIEKGTLWQRIVFPPMYRLSLRQFPRLDRAFWTDDRCNGCGICVRVCPANNVNLAGGKPAWRHKCEQCLSCLQWCPRESIQYGKKTPKYERYHHPAIGLKDILSERSGQQR